MSAPTEHRSKIAEARNVLGEVIARARFAGEPTILVNRGKEAAVIVGYDFYEQARRDAATLQYLRERAQEPEGGNAQARIEADALRKALDAADRRLGDSD